ncbi:sodium-dependent proline transporter-like [Babylonia areolata]|uniref:sodium-dependent proline transporter-like n=1 Tax=Babylonia areolata TaxID=304850 RepID=UPI003FD3A1F3
MTKATCEHEMASDATRLQPLGPNMELNLKASEEQKQEAAESEPESSEVEEEEERAKWTHSCEFVLSLVGYAVGVSNLWRFPYLCLKNGGGAFLIPFFFFLILAGIPLFYMEVCLGQFSGTSSLFVWKMCPLFRGLGYCMILVSGMACIYYNAVLSWIIYYLYSSFTSDLPWATCGHAWNTPTCMEPCLPSDSAPHRHCNSSDEDSAGNSSSSPVWEISVFPGANHSSEFPAFNGSVVMCADNVSSSSCVEGDWALAGGVGWNMSNQSVVAGMTSDGTSDPKSAAEEFWQYEVLRKSSGLHELGNLQLHSALCLLVAWLLVSLCLIRGVKSLGKVVYVTALLPYVLLTVFLVRGAMLPGAADGILFFIRPDFSRLASFSVWIEACLQVFYSLGPAWGGLITMASFNQFHNNCFRDAIIGALADGLTSLYGGFVIFSVVGFMAYEANSTVDKVATQGPGLALVAYPETISKLPLPPLWAILFFTMLLALGLDSQFGMFETVVSGMVDAFPRQLSKRRGTLTFVLAIASYLISLPIATRGGIYVFQLLDWYVSAFCVLLTSLIECIIIGWIYGVDRFSGDIELMLGHRPGLFMKLCWCFVTPFLMLMAFIFTTVTYKLPVYDGYVYPTEANFLGFLISVIPLIPIPIFMVRELMRHRGSLRHRFLQCLQPDPTWGPSRKEYQPMYAQQLPSKRSPLSTIFKRHVPRTDNVTHTSSHV